MNAAIPVATPVPNYDFDFFEAADQQIPTLHRNLHRYPEYAHLTLRQIMEYAQLYREIPSAIPIAQSADTEDYTQFGFVEYEVAFPISIASVANDQPTIPDVSELPPLV